VSLRRTTIALALAALLPGRTAAGGDLKDLFFGEALYYAYQEEWFEALERLDAEVAQHYRVDEPERDSLQYHIKNAEFDVGDFELRYRMHHRAGRAIKAVLEADVGDDVRNEAAYRLARIHFQKGQPDDALATLERIHGEIPEEIRDDVEFLRANVYLALRRPADAAEVLKKLQGSESLRGFSQYNLGIALLEEGEKKEAVLQLDRAGTVKGSDDASLAIVDKSNLILGTLLFEAQAFDESARSLGRVRLEGPFSNEALLRAGWADASAEKFDRALVPWGILAQREPTQAAVQEALLALPYAYSKLGVHGRAAVLYRNAAESFEGELHKLDASLASVRDGEFLKDLVREEIRQDKDWVVRLRSLPDAPETFYLTTLMASHEFQTGLQNYLDLEDMRKKLLAWQGSLDAFADLIKRRRAYYKPLLPGIDAQFRKLDSQIRLRVEQRDHLNQLVQHMLVAPRPDYLATSEELQASARIARLEAAVRKAKRPARDDASLRLARLKGALTWNLETQYQDRLTKVYTDLAALNKDIDAMTARYDSFVRARQAATQSYTGYDRKIADLRGRTTAAKTRLADLMKAQGELLEAVAMNELKVRRERLAVQLNQARFAFADSYDRATKAQAN